mmetsp:Transcript_7950/g.9803  ORF Transcript_7950/g.9803 Transcript_7950/m.9803 type:complete len:96 (-) Transcript_7950:50-337(-)
MPKPIPVIIKNLNQFFVNGSANWNLLNPKTENATPKINGPSSMINLDWVTREFSIKTRHAPKNATVDLQFDALKIPYVRTTDNTPQIPENNLIAT